MDKIPTAHKKVCPRPDCEPSESPLTVELDVRSPEALTDLSHT